MNLHYTPIWKEIPAIGRYLDEQGYRQLEFLGRGGTADVGKANDKEFERVVKVVRQPLHSHGQSTDAQPALDVNKEFQRLKDYVALGIEHPGRVKVIDYDETPVRTAAGKSTYLATVWELAPEGTLAKCQGKIELDELHKLLGPVAEATDYLHRHGFHHRDINPGNIFLFRNPPQARLGDLGCVKQVGQERTGSRVGTPGFVPPEMLGRGHSLPSSDLYSFAATYVKARTGKCFDQLGYHDGDGRWRFNDPDLPPEFEVVARALHKDPEKRPDRGVKAWLDEVIAVASGTAAATSLKSDHVSVPPTATGAAGASNGDGDKRFAAAGRIVHWQQAAAHCLDAQGTLFANRFAILEELGGGGSGVVYRAIDQREDAPTCGRELALKIPYLRPDHLAAGGRLQSEMSRQWCQHRWQIITKWISEINRQRGAGQVAPEGCAAVLDASVPDSSDIDAVLDQLNGQPIWFAMPLYRQTLAQYVAERAGKRGRLPVHDARRIMLAIAHTMQRLHQFKHPEDRDREIVHRDLKPSNILMDEKGNPFVADFGLAIGRYDQKLSGNPVSGTLAYMWPEQYGGEEATARSDIWAWGVISYWLLAGGRLPFEGNAAELRQRITSDRPPDSLSLMPGLPDHLVRIVMRCLEKDPADRFGSFAEVVQAIQEAELDPNRPPLKEVTDIAADTTGRPVGIEDLRYQRRWLTYVENQQAERQLKEFLSDPRPILWWGVVGPGGVGKSRMVYELVRDLVRDGQWQAGFLRNENDRLATDWLARDSRNWHPKSPTLIVIDYTTRDARALLSFLLNVCQTAWREAMGPAARVRVLFLDRPGGSIAPVSFEQLLEEDRVRSTAREQVRRFLYNAQPDPDDLPRKPQPIVRQEELLQLGGLPRETWSRVILEAAGKAGRTDLELKPDDDREWWERVARLTDNGRPLFLQILGICFARRPDHIDQLTGGDAAVETLLDDMLQHERQGRWRELLNLQPGESPDELLQAVERVVGFITLAGGITWPRDEDIVRNCIGAAWDRVAPTVQVILQGYVEPDGTSWQLPRLQPGDWVRRGATISVERTTNIVTMAVIDFPRHRGAANWFQALLDLFGNGPPGLTKSRLMKRLLATASRPACRWPQSALRLLLH